VADKRTDGVCGNFLDHGPLDLHKRKMRMTMLREAWHVNREPAHYSVFAKFAFGWLRSDVDKYLDKLQASYLSIQEDDELTAVGVFETLLALWPPKIPCGTTWTNLRDCGVDVDIKKFQGRKRPPLPSPDTEDEDESFPLLPGFGVPYIKKWADSAEASKRAADEAARKVAAAVARKAQEDSLFKKPPTPPPSTSSSKSPSPSPSPSRSTTSSSPSPSRAQGSPSPTARSTKEKSPAGRVNASVPSSSSGGTSSISKNKSKRKAVDPHVTAAPAGEILSKSTAASKKKAVVPVVAAAPEGGILSTSTEASQPLDQGASASLPWSSARAAMMSRCREVMAVKAKKLKSPPRRSPRKQRTPSKLSNRHRRELNYEETASESDISSDSGSGDDFKVDEASQRLQEDDEREDREEERLARAELEGPRPPPMKSSKKRKQPQATSSKGARAKGAVGNGAKKRKRSSPPQAFSAVSLCSITPPNL
jgi:hypothetical protein